MKILSTAGDKTMDKRAKFALFTCAILLMPAALLADVIQVHPLHVNGKVYDLGRDNNDGVHVIWLNGGSLFYGKIQNGAIVGREEIPDSSDVKTRFTRPRLAVEPNGQTVHTSWAPGNGYAIVHVWRDGQGWHRQLAWEQDDTSVHAAVPSIGVDLTGTVHIIAQQWYDPPNDDQGPIIYLRKPPGGAWSQASQIQNPNGRQWRDTSMFTDSSGGVHATWKDGGGVPGKYRYAPSGTSLSQSSTVDIERMPDTNILSFGDTWVTWDGDVHHAFCSFRNMYDSWIDYAVKPSGDADFSEHSRISDLLPHCETAKYDDPWPAVAASSSATVYVAWAICESAKAAKVNEVYLADKQNDGWNIRRLTNTADIDSNSKPAMTATSNAVYVLWRDDSGQLMLAEITPGSPDAGIDDDGSDGSAANGDDKSSGDADLPEDEMLDGAENDGEDGSISSEDDGEQDSATVDKPNSDIDKLLGDGCNCSGVGGSSGGTLLLMLIVLVEYKNHGRFIQ